LAIAPRALLRPFLIVGAVCAIVPDVDAIGRPFYGAGGDLEMFGGHRGFLHSLTFATLLGPTVACATLMSARWDGSRLKLAMFLAAVTDVTCAVLQSILEPRLYRLVASHSRAVQRTVFMPASSHRAHSCDLVRAEDPMAAARQRRAGRIEPQVKSQTAANPNTSPFSEAAWETRC
jgi:hypothetical protein